MGISRLAWYYANTHSACRAGKKAKLYDDLYSECMPKDPHLALDQMEIKRPLNLRLLEPVAGSPVAGSPVAGSIDIFFKCSKSATSSKTSKEYSYCLVCQDIPPGYFTDASFNGREIEKQLEIRDLALCGLSQWKAFKNSDKAMCAICHKHGATEEWAAHGCRLCKDCFAPQHHKGGFACLARLYDSIPDRL